MIAQLRAGISSLRKDGFLQSVGVLSGGIGLAQVVVVAASPIITRLYNPGDLGVLSAFAAILGIVLIGACLRFERAIPLAVSTREYVALVWASSGVMLANAGILAVVVWLVGDAVVRLMSVPELAPYLWMLPLGLVFAGLYELLTYVAVRKLDYRLLSRTKLIQGVGMAATQVGLGLIGLGPAGLIVGDIVGRSLGIRSVARSARELWRYRPKRIATLSAVCTKHWRFPAYATPSGLLNRSASLAPNLLFLSLYSPEVAGLVYLAERTVVGPLSFLGRSVAKVFFGYAAEAYRQEQGGVARLVDSTAMRLFIIGGLPIGLIALLGPALFRTVFGPEWTESGLYVRYMAVPLLLQFAIGPLLQTLFVIERQGRMVLFDAVRFGFVLGSIYATHRLGAPASVSVIVYGIALGMSYLVGYLLVKHSLSIAASRRGTAEEEKSLSTVP